MTAWSFIVRTENAPKSDPRMVYQSDDGKGLVVIAVNQDTLRLYRWRLDAYSGDQEVVQTAFNKRLKVIYMYYFDDEYDPDGSSLELIVVDEENRMRYIWVVINSSSPYVDFNYSSLPLDYISFDRILTRGAASPDLWDFWLFGATTTMTLNGEPLVF